MTQLGGATMLLNPHGMPEFNSKLSLLFSKLLVISQAAEDIYFKGNHTEGHFWCFRRVSAQSSIAAFLSLNFSPRHLCHLLLKT